MNVVVPTPPRASRSALRPISVLLVDDDNDTSSMLAVVLEHAGYTVETASHGREALELLRLVVPCVILLDLEMPVMNGAQFREKQRQDRDLIRIPTIVLTGSREEPVLDPAISRVLHKPCTSKKLMAVVAEYASVAS